ncbi:hypothetical protein JQ557_05815 [Bradyrhizobium sp. U87765 SZCCT0131]|uniref:hypothetical protein n=1 Tax=unclassified Bradyrhizobium TaxID=2631580 RepID=UPI001BA70511|nr:MULTISPECIES: hypothetical protein [unclassified Bradyrhizobium]MBR1217493.1 hypothetical protein [Bradyrhizobium sp. U87765 SZCCT0131]MBR1264909.1 hypothetical protein [Bradyrhizobium sp. U87765 SZCCT0134]MBR1304891.1 hypothetical protein [Bradyrhizobium sp. U87765 SZCCT0110]MBR1320678.1 hypothetical protein [Bradyrhizobium sp. U87765 SZCCT0109]MBR1349098.1 hypothetical protein [Bradyrhizobium sp. U87765 SZCCT0048]
MASKIVKCRFPEADKEAVANAAKAGGVTVSDLLRRAAKAAVNGRIASRPILADLVHVRSLAHRLDSLAAVAGGDARVSAEIKAAAETLREIARRHLVGAQ